MITDDLIEVEDTEIAGKIINQRIKFRPMVSCKIVDDKGNVHKYYDANEVFPSFEKYSLKTKIPR